MKNSIKLLMAAAIATSAPFLSSDALADGGYDYGPQFGQVDAKFLDNGDVQLGFEQSNIRRQWGRYSMQADLQTSYRCLDRRGQYTGGVITRRDPWQDAGSFQASRQGIIRGQFLMPRGRLLGRDACRGSYERPVIIRISLADLRLLDETNNRYHYRDRVSCGGDYGYDAPQYVPSKGEGQYVPGKGEGQYIPGKGEGQYVPGQIDQQYGAEGQYDTQYGSQYGSQYDTQYGSQYDAAPLGGQYSSGKGEGQFGLGKADLGKSGGYAPMK